MKIELCDHEVHAISRIFSLSAAAGRPEDFFSEYLACAAGLTGADHRWSVLFPGKFTSSLMIVSDEDDGFNRGYFEDFWGVGYDRNGKGPAVDAVSPGDVLSRPGLSFTERRQADGTVHGYCHSPIVFGESVIGFWGLARTSSAAAFGEREERILNLLEPAVASALQCFFKDRKIQLMDEVICSDEIRSLFYIRSDGTAEFPADNRIPLIMRALGTEDLSCRALRENPLLRELYYDLPPVFPFRNPLRVRTVHRDNETFIIKLCDRREMPEALGIDAVVVIEKEAGACPLDCLMDSYGLTRREGQIIEHISVGRSNREIGRLLGISEQTVKRHVANIFEKTGSCSRTRLLSLLSACG